MNTLSGGEAQRCKIAKYMNASLSDLLYILDDLQNFDIKEASAKLENLLRYNTPKNVRDACVAAQEKLESYDDDEAEKIIQEILREI